MITASPTLTRVRTRPQISLAAAAAWLLRDLESRRLSVALRAAPDKRHSGHKVRCVESRNPAWYRQLCAQHITHRTRPRRRKPKFVDTLIKRRHVLRALAEIQRGGGEFSEYARRVLPYVQRCQDWLQDPDGYQSIFEEE